MSNTTDVKSIASQPGPFLNQRREILKQFRALEFKRGRGEDQANTEYIIALGEIHKIAEESESHYKNILDSHLKSKVDLTDKIAKELDLKINSTNFSVSPSPNYIPKQEFEKIEKLFTHDYQQLDYTYKILRQHLKQNDLIINLGSLISVCLFLIIIGYIREINLTHILYFTGCIIAVLGVIGLIKLFKNIQKMSVEGQDEIITRQCPECGSTYHKKEKFCKKCNRVLIFL